MIPVMQTKVSTIDGKSKGNCFEACIASLLEIPIEEVPRFNDMGPIKWHIPFHNFLRDKGYQCYGTGRPTTHDLATYPGVDGYVIVSGKSPREWVKDGHAVIYKNGVLAHDPHPSKEGILTIDSWFLIERQD